MFVCIRKLLNYSMNEAVEKAKQAGQKVLKMAGISLRKEAYAKFDYDGTSRFALIDEYSGY